MSGSGQDKGCRLASGPAHVWHYDEEIISRGSSPKPASPGSLELIDGAPGSGFVALHLISDRQEVDIQDWVIVERTSDPRDVESSPGPDVKLTSSPSEEPEEGPVQPMDESPDRERSTPSAIQGHVLATPKVERLELCVVPADVLVSVTPTSPAEALAEGALTQVRSNR